MVAILLGDGNIRGRDHQAIYVLYGKVPIIVTRCGYDYSQNAKIIVPQALARIFKQGIGDVRTGVHFLFRISIRAFFPTVLHDGNQQLFQEAEIAFITMDCSENVLEDVG